MAGSGKSTYCKKLEDEGCFYIAHDKWVKAEYADYESGAYSFVNSLLGESVINEDRTINFKKLGEILIVDDDLNYIFIDYFTSKFAAYICWQIELLKISACMNKNIVIEIPYLDHSIHWLQRKYPEIEVISVQTSDKEQYYRLIKRGWSEERISKSRRLYFDMYQTYGGYYTKILNGVLE